MRLISGGFYITRLLRKPQGLGEVLPDSLITLSPCLAEFLPDAWASSWASHSDSDRVAAVQKLGLAPDALPFISEFVNAAFATQDLGWPNVWQSATVAKNLIADPRVADRGLLLLELAVPEDFATILLKELAPAAGEADSGLFAKLKTATPARSSATSLGWEVLGVETGGSCHSWLCNSIQDDAKQRLGLRPGPFGLLESEQDARAVLGLIANGLGVEPVPWFPGLLSRVT